MAHEINETPQVQSTETQKMHRTASKSNIDLISLLSETECYIVAASGTEDVRIGGIAYRSDQVKPGDIFFCIVGAVTDGHEYAQDAVDRGAAAVVTERVLYIDNVDVPIVIVDDTKKAMGEIASRFYGYPSLHMDLVGVTGTNGKTTTTYLISHILDACGKACGIIGTTGAIIGDEHVELDDRTTPESPVTNALLACMEDKGIKGCAMEVSSHALSLRRVWGLRFAVTAFTNLTQDHLDYHHSFEEYFEAKAKLFSSDMPAVRVINMDDEWGQELYARCQERGDEIITYSMFEADSIDIYPMSASFGNDRTKATLKVFGTSYSLEYSLVGRFNLYNVMCALGCAVACGCDKKNAIRSLREAISVPGRIEHVTMDECLTRQVQEENDIPSVYVDYAHTPDAVKKACETAAMLKGGIDKKAVVVVGCGGDRDSQKRPLMGQAALARMDFAYITSDNPRTEDPDDIITDVVTGISDEKYAGKFAVVPDRAEAIIDAIDDASYGDVVLIAGKGHESYQIIGNKKYHFDDREVAAGAIKAKIERAMGR